MKLNLKHLEAFIWVVDLGSFRKAATRLHTTQPSISNRIALLETTLDVKLLERGAGSVHLTPKGRELVAHARQVLKASENLISASNLSNLVDGTLHLGVTELVVHTWLQSFLKSVNEQFPNILVELTVDISVNLTRDLFDRTIDLALQNSPFDRTTSGCEALGSYPLVWVASPALGLPVGHVIDTAAFCEYPILTHTRETSLFKQISEHFTAEQGSRVQLVPSNNLGVCLFMAINAMGVASMPHAMVKDVLASGDVIEIDYHWKPDNLEFMARYDTERSPGFVAKIAQLASQTAQACEQQ